MDIEAHVRAEIEKQSPGVGFSDPQIAAIIEIVKNVLDTQRATLVPPSGLPGLR